MVLSDKEGLGPKLFVTGWAFMECLLFGGLLYGWTSVNFVLKAEGIYADLCPTLTLFNATPGPNNLTVTYDPGTGFNGTVNVVPVITVAPPTGGEGRNNTDIDGGDGEGLGKGLECKPQDSNMALCFTIGSAMFCVGCAVLGHVNYKFGTRVTRIISFIMFVIGALMMAFISKENPWLMYPGLSCLGIGGLPLLVTNAQVMNLFSKGSSSVIGLLCGAFDMSSAVMLLVKLASENGFPRQNMFFVLTGLHVLVLVSTFFFLPKDFIKKRATDSGGPQEVARDQEAGVELIDKKGDNKGAESGADESSKPTLWWCVRQPMFLTHVAWLCLIQLRFYYFIGAESGADESSKPTLWWCVRQPMFLTHVAWLCLIQLRFYYFIGTLIPHLSRVLDGDEAQVSHFTNVVSYIMMGGLVTSFFSGIVYDLCKNWFKEGKSERYRQVAPAAVPQGLASLLAVLLSVLVLVPSPGVLYLTFIVLVLMRSFLYSLGAAFIGEVFPGEYFGMLYGIMIICSGIFCILQYALFTWAEAYIGGATHANIFLVVVSLLSSLYLAYLWVSGCYPIVCWANIFLVAVSLLSFLHPAYLWISSWREERKFKLN